MILFARRAFSSFSKLVNSLKNTPSCDRGESFESGGCYMKLLEFEPCSVQRFCLKLTVAGCTSFANIFMKYHAGGTLAFEQQECQFGSSTSDQDFQQFTCDLGLLRARCCLVPSLLLFSPVKRDKFSEPGIVRSSS